MFKNKVVIHLNLKKAQAKPRSLLKATPSQGAGTPAQGLAANFGPGKAELNCLLRNASPVRRQGSREAPPAHRSSCLSNDASGPVTALQCEDSDQKKARKDLGDHVKPFRILPKIMMSTSNHSCFLPSLFFGGLLIQESDSLSTMVVVPDANRHQQTHSARCRMPE